MTGRGVKRQVLRHRRGHFPQRGHFPRPRAVIAGGLTLILAALVLGTIWGTGHAGEKRPNHPVNLSLFYPISTNGNREISTNFRLNLFYGELGDIRGIDLTGIGGHTYGDVVGFQVCGFYSHIEGDLRGVSIVGATNYVKSNAAGFQYACLVNFIRGDFTGFQMSNLFNYVEGSMSGAQANLVFNLNDGDVKYFQYSTIANAVAGNVTGIQLATGLNYANGQVAGGQVALCNFGKHVRGIQVGLGNVAETVKGVQLGFVNVAREVDGIPLGMFNFVEEGDEDWVTFGSNIAAASTGVRSIYHHFYSVLAVGVGDLQEERYDTAFLSWHYGYAMPIASRFKMGVDLGYVHIMPASSSDPDVDTRNQFAIQLRAIGEVKVIGKTKIFGGAGASARFSAYSMENTATTDPLFVLGISLY
jgi:hypothetical protein